MAMLLWSCLICAGVDDVDQMQRLQGEWVVVSAERNGTPLARKEFETDVVTFDKSEMFVDRKGSIRNTYKVTIDGTRDPKRIDLVGVAGLDQGKTLRGIFQLDGDRLTLCAGLQERPGAFRTATDSMLRLMTLERRKK
jgi:uncharacterized protein (TIGR03067 family)